MCILWLPLVFGSQRMASLGEGMFNITFYVSRLVYLLRNLVKERMDQPRHVNFTGHWYIGYLWGGLTSPAVSE